MKNIEKIIAIDPDLNASGLAIFNTDIRELDICRTINIWDLFNLLLNYDLAFNILVLLEQSTNKATWHSGGVGASQNVGKNKAVASIIKDFMVVKKINHKILEPNGYSNYFDKESIVKVTGFTGSTNKDSRSAVAMIYKNLYNIVKYD